MDSTSIITQIHKEDEFANSFPSSEKGKLFVRLNYFGKVLTKKMALKFWNAKYHLFHCFPSAHKYYLNECT